MSPPLPFAMTPQAADHIRSLLGLPRAGREFALITVLRSAEMVDGQERVWFEGEHFAVGIYDIGARPDARHINLFGHQVSIVPSTLEALRGRTLTIRHVVDASGIGREVLVAA